MRHVPGVDTLRGISVLLVVAHHLAIRLPLTKSAVADVLPERLLLAVNWNGYEAVCLFFVVSGFLLTGHTLDRDGAPARVRPLAFWARRLARIGPPLVVVVAALCAAHQLGVKHFVIDPERQSLQGAVASAFGLYLNVYEGRTGYLPGGWDVLWSLSVEEVFYLGFPVVLLATRDARVLAALMAVFAATLPITHGHAWNGDNEIWREKAYLPCMSAIAAGVVAAVVARGLSPRPWRDRTLQALGVAAMLGPLGWGDRLWPVLGEGTLLLLVVGAAVFVVGAYGDRGRAPSPVTAPLRSVGRLSYEIYLTHMFVVFAVVEGFAALNLGKREGGWAYPVALCGSWALGFVFATVVAEPARRAVLGRLRGWTDRPGELTAATSAPGSPSSAPAGSRRS